MKTEITICDRCGRELNKVDTGSLNGKGKLYFAYSVGSHGGGSGREIDIPDLCVECTVSIRKKIDEWKIIKPEER